MPREVLGRALDAIFYLKKGTAFRYTLTGSDYSSMDREMIEFGSERSSLLLVNSMRRSSAIQDRSIRVKKLIEYRLFLYVL